MTGVQTCALPICIVFEEYRAGVGGKLDGVEFIPMHSNATVDDGHAFFFPMGCPGLFIQRNAPADYIESVNTVGLPFYAKQERMVMDKGILIETQQNPLCLCTRPMTLVEGTST